MSIKLNIPNYLNSNADPLNQEKVDELIEGFQKGEIQTLSFCYGVGAFNHYAHGKKMTLEGIDFSGKDLRGIDFGKTNLSFCNFDGANLSGCHLMGANLHYANLSGADLSNANMSGTNLTGTNLTGTNLEGANMTLATKNVDGHTMYYPFPETA
ncbi:MAG: pentapeptide repeat-containing protein [Bacteroidota bacterium]